MKYFVCVKLLSLAAAWSLALSQESDSNSPEIFESDSRALVIDENAVICEICQCTESVPFIVNCSGLGIDQSFSSSSWSSLKTKESIEVYFDDNKISRVAQFDSLPIVKLSFLKNAITAIENAAFKNLRQLKTLQLGHNSIHSVNKNAFDDLPSLEVLELRNNPMEVIDHETSLALAKLKKITYLDLAETGIINIPEGLLRSFPDLTHLIVNGNRFKSVPAELQHAAKLEYLNIGGNLIREINEETFQGLNNLKYLNISHLPRLEYIGKGSFSAFQQLEIFDCSFNPKLSKIHSRAFGKTEDVTSNLREFTFRNNAIEVLPFTLLPWDLLETVDVSGNPLKCDCTSLWIKTLLIPKFSKNSGLSSEIICESPEEYQGSSLESIKLNCDPDYDPSNVTLEEDFITEAVNPAIETSSMNTTITIVAILGTLAVIGGMILLGYFSMRKKNVKLSKLCGSPSRPEVRYAPTRVEDPEARDTKQVAVEIKEEN